MNDGPITNNEGSHCNKKASHNLYEQRPGAFPEFSILGYDIIFYFNDSPKDVS
jgi:hypothetical protein